ncbi:PTS system mannose/fructose/sorbose family transporter subunit IID [Thermophilibacter immobilis]|uniref:PTS system mannose/fructose/sorbose family transporter subunit IID n=1 Tax=Thermophilibacter immobilis TaxID=2779519 RepID=A0A7S7M890_9ACTN|nr:PTS system mannose/fructose/sorbose family transporter subunit IID [Thermophilibacter immobilis]QOY60567.1 PTS system mannose/fructose/sorbose family transporter subunit IID [Thermophilibacter immobilis]
MTQDTDSPIDAKQKSELKSLEPKPVSERKRLWQFFWRTWAIQSSWNYQGQMNLGFLYSIAPTLDRIYTDESDPEILARKKEAYHRHTALYNITQQLNSFVLGLAASMEEEYGRNPEDFNPEVINSLKVSLMGPLSGIGDSLLEGTLRIISFGLGASLAAQGSILGPILALIISGVPKTLITWFGGKVGYTLGTDYVKQLQDGGIMDRVMYVASVVGLMTVGAMIATMIGITTPLEFQDGAVVLQSVFDGIFPAMIPLLITWLLYTLLKKKIGLGWLLSGCIVVSLVCSFFGLLA